MTIAAFHQLSIDGADFVVRVEQASLNAALHAVEHFLVHGEAVSDDGTPATIDADNLLGAAATLTLPSGDQLLRFDGVVASVSVHGMNEVTVTFAHPMVALTHTRDHRVFVGQDVVSIVETVLGDHQLSVDKRLDGSFEPRLQCVQAFESDLDFVSRLLAQEGISWFVERDGPATLVLADHSAAFKPIAGDDSLRYGSGDGLLHEESVTAARYRHRLRHDKATLRDSWFETPALDLDGEASVRDGVLEHYAFPGPNRFVEPAHGRRLAGRWLDSLRRDAVVLEGRSTCPRLAVGRTFVLAGAPRRDMNRRWLVVALSTSSRERHAEQRFEARFTAVPADANWRPAIPEAPSLGGVQTATITGPAGDEIHTEAYGRVTALHRYDRRGKQDDSSSSWMRVLHPPTSGGFMLPRVGWEALVAYCGPSGDLPFVLGRLDNGAAPTAESLPGQLRRGNFGTPTTPGGGSANMLRMDDGAGGEQLRIDASRDFNEQTKANKATKVSGDDVRIISSNQDLTYESNHGIKTDGLQTIDVGSKRTVTGNGGMLITAGSENVAVGALREFTVGGHLTSKIGGNLVRAVLGAKVVLPIAGNSRFVNGASAVLVAGNWMDIGLSSSISVGGASLLACSSTTINAAKLSIEASGVTETGGARTETAGANIALQSKTVALAFGDTTLTGPTVSIWATSVITISGGGATISVTPGNVEIGGAFNAGGWSKVGGNAKHG